MDRREVQVDVLLLGLLSLGFQQPKWGFHQVSMGDFTQKNGKIYQNLRISAEKRIVCQWKMFQNEDFTTAKNSCGLM